jgi:hypothetical protein
MRYILLKLTNGELVKIGTDDVVFICVAETNEKDELHIRRTIDVPELEKTVEYPQTELKGGDK